MEKLEKETMINNLVNHLSNLNLIKKERAKEYLDKNKIKSTLEIF